MEFRVKSNAGLHLGLGRLKNMLFRSRDNAPLISGRSFWAFELADIELLELLKMLQGKRIAWYLNHLHCLSTRADKQQDEENNSISHLSMLTANKILLKLRR